MVGLECLKFLSGVWEIGLLVKSWISILKEGDTETTLWQIGKETNVAQISFGWINPKPNSQDETRQSAHQSTYIPLAKT